MNRKSSESPRIVRELTSTAALLRSVPLSVTVLFIAAVLAMNFLARITLLSLPFLALNAGITVSWLSFLLMDVMTRHYGPRAATQLSVVAILVNLCCCFFCVVLSRVKGLPGLDMVVGGQWSILTASTIAFVISALTNNYTNCYIGRFFRKNPDGKAAFAARSFVSTFLSQVVDNFLFVFLAFVVMPYIPGALQVRWTVSQCIGCSVFCAILELLSEVVVAPIGYYILKRWKEEDVGREYLEQYCPNGVL
ncbi:MAG: VUT family protein [Stomatobaculum sp.]|nr:VUT family protein [Stomatobaculum sp.]